LAARQPVRTRASTTSSQLKDQDSTKSRPATATANVCRQLSTANPARLHFRLSCLHAHGIGMWRLLANLALPSSCTRPLSGPSSAIPPSPSTVQSRSFTHVALLDSSRNVAFRSAPSGSSTFHFAHIGRDPGSPTFPRQDHGRMPAPLHLHVCHGLSGT